MSKQTRQKRRDKTLEMRKGKRRLAVEYKVCTAKIDAINGGENDGRKKG